MRSNQLRDALPWLIGVSLAASLCCLALAFYLSFAARTEAVQTATREVAAQADNLARHLGRRSRAVRHGIA